MHVPFAHSFHSACRGSTAAKRREETSSVCTENVSVSPGYGRAVLEPAKPVNIRPPASTTDKLLEKAAGSHYSLWQSANIRHAQEEPFAVTAEWGSGFFFPGEATFGSPLLDCGSTPIRHNFRLKFSANRSW